MKFEHFYMNSHLISFSSKCAKLGISLHDELEKMFSWSPKQNSLFNEIVKATSAKPQHEEHMLPQENKLSQVSICSSCNYSNEYIDYDPNYKCYKCKKGL